MHFGKFLVIHEILNAIIVAVVVYYFACIDGKFSIHRPNKLFDLDMDTRFLDQVSELSD